MVGSPGEMLATITGMFAFGYWTPEMSTRAWFPIIVGSAAFAGPSGMQQMWFTLYLRDKRAGMAHYSGRITSCRCSWLNVRRPHEAQYRTGSTPGGCPDSARTISS